MFAGCRRVSPSLNMMRMPKRCTMLRELHTWWGKSTSRDTSSTLRWKEDSVWSWAFRRVLKSLEVLLPDPWLCPELLTREGQKLQDQPQLLALSRPNILRFRSTGNGSRRQTRKTRRELLNWRRKPCGGRRMKNSWSRSGLRRKRITKWSSAVRITKKLNWHR